MALRVALFVEGSEGPAAKRTPLLQAMWGRLATDLGVRGFSAVVPIVKTIRADARNKDPWLEYLLRRLLEDPEARALVLAHPICRRLAECLAPP